jgi:hypothetical protein
MARLPEALERALEQVASSPDASIEEAMHELGITTPETVALVVQIDKHSSSKGEAIGYALYIGLVLGRGLAE